MRQPCLFDTLVLISKWKGLHDERVRKKLDTEFNFLLTRLGSASSYVAGSHHGNSDLFCVKGPGCQPRNNEHRHSGVFFLRCPTDGGWQHQQVGGSRV